jgi:septum site-determining protein MinD
MLAIAGGKGGCGKTTTTLGLAAAADGETLVVDADRDMPNLHSLAGVPRDAEGGPHEHPVYGHVSVAPAPPRGASADGGCGGGRGDGSDRDDDTAERLRRLRRRARSVLVDCPAGAGPDAAVPLRECDGVLVVSSLCAPSLRDAAKTASMARALGTPAVGAVLTRAHVAPPGVDELLGCPVLGRVPEADPPVLDAARVKRAYENVFLELQAAEALI